MPLLPGLALTRSLLAAAADTTVITLFHPLLVRKTSPKKRLEQSTAVSGTPVTLAFNIVSASLRIFYGTTASSAWDPKRDGPRCRNASAI